MKTKPCRQTLPQAINLAKSGPASRSPPEGPLAGCLLERARSQGDLSLLAWRAHWLCHLFLETALSGCAPLATLSPAPASLQAQVLAWEACRCHVDSQAWARLQPG